MSAITEQLIKIFPEFIALVMTLLGGFVAWKVNQWKNAGQKKDNAEVIERAIKNGILFAQSLNSEANMEEPAVQENLLKTAFQYVVEHTMDELQSSGFDLAKGEDRDYLRNKIRARLAPAILVANSTPGMVSVAAAATLSNPNINNRPVDIQQ